MRKVHTAESLVDVAHLRNVLEQAGIRCVVRNDRLGGIVGEIPFLECWPELWVLQPGDALRARGLIELALCSPAVGSPWTCPDCGECLDAAFTECWRCVVNPPGAGEP